MSKIIFRLILISVIALLAILSSFAWWNLRTSELQVTVVERVELEDALKPELERFTNLFEIDPGVRADFGSNPMVIAQSQESLTLAYESRAENSSEQSLKRSPEEKVRVMKSIDGLEFESVEWTGSRVFPLPLEMPDGTYRRYVYEPESGGVVSYSSSSVEMLEKDEGLRYAIEGADIKSPNVFGVWTTFVDSQGGVVLLYNKTDEQGRIVVNRAYALPETQGLEFMLTDEGVLNGTLDEELYADPHTLVRENGEIWLVIMNQSRTKHPPLSREGIIYAYVSRDDGKTFEREGRIIGWDDFDQFEVYSLNDPKLVEFPDGTLRVYVAAMVRVGEGREDFDWHIVSAHD
jgi:hypothetical protein